MANAYKIEPWISTGPVFIDNDTDEVLLTCDVSVSEQHEESVSAPQHPVEAGFPVSDNTDPDPKRLSLTVGWTDTPHNETPVSLRAIKRHRQLLSLILAGNPVSVITGIKVYGDMHIKRVSTPRSVDSGWAIVCDVELEQIRFAVTELVEVPAKYLTGGGKGAAGEGDKGKQNTGEATETNALCEQYPNASVWWRIRNGCLFEVPESQAGAVPEE